MSEECFWSGMDDVRAAMLSIGEARHVPMSPYPEAGERAIWFITAQGTDLVKAVEDGAAATSLIIVGEDDFYARVEGTAALIQDRTKLEELWNPVASSWFDGIDDPDIRLLRVTPSEAEVWATKGALGFMIALAKSKATGKKPDMGDHFTVRF